MESRIEHSAVASLMALTLLGGAAITVITVSVKNEGVEALGLKVGLPAAALFKASSVMVAAQV